MQAKSQAIREFYEMARRGDHPACSGCPWNPRSADGTAFGISCLEHGFDWRNQDSAVSLQIAQDPGGTTPATTGTLCLFCNRSTPTDRSAQHGHALWEAAVAGDCDEESAERLHKGHVWSNAVLHGDGPQAYFSEARRRCGALHKEHLALLRPRVIIASGAAAAETLLDLGLLRRRWPEFSSNFDVGPHYERRGGQDVFVTYHTAAKVVNTAVESRYSHRTVAKLKSMQPGPAASRFLQEHQNNRAMLLLFLHWERIGRAVRRAAGVVV
jgi:hypothetical protein